MAFKAGKLHDEDNSPPAPVQVANDEEDVESQPIPRTQHHFLKRSFFLGYFWCINMSRQSVLRCARCLPSVCLNRLAEKGSTNVLLLN